MKKIKKHSGFTLTELLVVIGIIGILAIIIVPSLTETRLRAKDAAVAVALSSFRIDAELEFNGEFAELCTSDIFAELESVVVGYGGEIAECETNNVEFRVIAILPSTVASYIASTSGFTNVAYAQVQSDISGVSGFGEGGYQSQTQQQAQQQTQQSSVVAAELYSQFGAYCVNSRGIASLLPLNDIPGPSAGFASVLDRLPTDGESANPVETEGVDVGTGLGGGGGVGLRLLKGLVQTVYAQTSYVLGGGSATPDFYCTYEEKARELNVSVESLKQQATEAQTVLVP